MEEENILIGTRVTELDQKSDVKGEGLDAPAFDKANCISVPLSVLKKHVSILGASGSGKTVLGKVIVEEAAIQGIPSIIIDPQGDLASLAILAKKGIVESKGTSAVSYANYLNRAEVRIFTPASTKGIPLSINPLKTPPKDISNEDLIKSLDLVCGSLSRILGYKPGTSERKAAKNFLFEFLKRSWQSGTVIKDFSQFSSMVLEPSIVGLDDPSVIITDRERKKLSKNLNYLSIGMDQLLFNFGLPVDMGAFLDTVEEGKVPVNVIYLNTLTSEEHKQFFVAMIAREIYSYMLQHPSKEVQLLFLIDEIAPYLPPHPRKPPAKEMLKLLFKQGRKYGVSCIMCTQNPADVDYKAMAQANTWALGRMMAKQDLDKVKHILKTGPLTRYTSLLKKLPSLKPGEFVLISPDAFSRPTEIRVRYLITEHTTLEEDSLDEHIPEQMKEYFKEYMVVTKERVGDGEEKEVDAAGLEEGEECVVSNLADMKVPRGYILFLRIVHPQNEIERLARKELDGTIIKKERIEDVRLRLEPLWRVGFNAEDYVGLLRIPIIGKKEVQHRCVYFHGKSGKVMNFKKESLVNALRNGETVIFSDLNLKHPLKLDLFADAEVCIKKVKELPVTAPRFTFNEKKVRSKMETTFGKKPDRIQKLLLPVWEFSIREKELKQKRTLYIDAVYGNEVILD